MNQKPFQVILDKDLSDQLVQIAKENQRDKSSMVRWLISQEYERLIRSKKNDQPTAN